MHEISNPLTCRTKTGRLSCARICPKATEHRIGGRLLLWLLLLRLLLRLLLLLLLRLTECSCSLAKRCPVQVKNEEKKRAIREITHLQSGRIHPSGQRLIH